ncbi:MAG: sugar phosphate nucleotidyltransferase, partial [Pseudomonadota bacterium]
MNIGNRIRIRPVVLAGGVGKRLWPISNEETPKQFLSLAQEESLLTTTLKRFSNIDIYYPPIIVGNSRHSHLIRETLAKLNINDAVTIFEPLGRSTAAAAIIAAICEKDKNMLHILLPSDHNIEDEKVFHDKITEACIEAKNSKIVLFGIAPNYPETGYGYILSEKKQHNNNISKITKFVEKPNKAKAENLINSGALWNSGIFLYNPSLLIEEANKIDEYHYDNCKFALIKAKVEADYITLNKAEYLAIKSHSFDNLIMENTDKGMVIKCAMGWSDLGSWHSLWKNAKKDDNNNYIKGQVSAKDINNSYIYSDDKNIVAIGLQDVVIAAKNNSIIVCSVDKSSEVKDFLEYEKIEPQKPVAEFIERPWGVYPYALITRKLSAFMIRK